MFLNELLECLTDRFRKTLQDLDTENMADKLYETCLAVFINLTQQILGDMWMFGVKQLGKFVGLGRSDILGVPDFCKYGIALSQVRNQGFDHLPIAADTDRLAFGPELNPLLVVQLVCEVKFDRAGAGCLLAKLHQRAKSDSQFIKGIFHFNGIVLCPVKIGLRSPNQLFFFLDKRNAQR